MSVVQHNYAEFWPVLKYTNDLLQQNFRHNFENCVTPTKNNKKLLLQRVNQICKGSSVAFLDKEFCSSRFVAKHGKLFNHSVVCYKLMCEGGCHDNVFILYHLGAIKQMCTGFVCDIGNQSWIHHSWGLDDENNIVETCHIRPDLYFGVILSSTSTFRLPEVVTHYPITYDYVIGMKEHK